MPPLADITAATLASLALLAGPLAAQEPPVVDPEAGFIQVSGNAQIDVPADRAHVVFAVETEAPDARTAVEDNATLMDAVLTALRGLEAPGLHVETRGFQLQPQYSRINQPQGAVSRISGYRAHNNVTATVDDVDAVGRIIDAAVGAGANRIASLTFEARDTEAARAEALRMAVAEAREQARVMAEALGLPLGPPLEVNGGARQAPPPPMAGVRFEMAQAAPTTPVEAGDQTVSASVTIKYRLGGGGE